MKKSRLFWFGLSPRACLVLTLLAGLTLVLTAAVPKITHAKVGSARLEDVSCLLWHPDGNPAGLDLLHRSLESCRKTGSLAGEGVSLSELGRVYALGGRGDRAEFYYLQALHAWRKLGDLSAQAEVLTSLGLVRRDVGNIDQAVQALQRARRLWLRLGDHRGAAYALTALAGTTPRSSNPAESLSLLLEVLSYWRRQGDRTGEIETLLGIGRAQELLGRSHQAAAAYAEAVKLSRSVEHRREEALALWRYAQVARSVGQLERAKVAAEEALEVAESLRVDLPDSALRASYFASSQQFYEIYIDVLMELHRQSSGKGYDAAAFEVSERARAYRWLKAPRSSCSDTEKVDHPVSLQRTEHLRSQLATLERQRLAVLREWQDDQGLLPSLERKISELLDAYEASWSAAHGGTSCSGFAPGPQPLTLSEIQSRLLDKETALLSFSLGEERSFVWVVTRESFSGRELPPRGEIEATARQFHQTLSESYRRITRKPAQREAERLSRLLLSPIMESLSGAYRLAIIPDGTLGQVPFAVLPDPEHEGASLLDHHEIVMLPSASVLASLRQEQASRPVPQRTIAVLADPIFDASDPRLGRKGVSWLDPQVAGEVSRSTQPSLERLPYSGWEAEKIASLYPSIGTLKAVGLSANRETVITDLAPYRILHFASHSISLDDQPAGSWLVLSLVDEQGRPKDGFLLGNDIEGLSLSADLVVLSTCQTPLASSPNPREQPASLARSFMAAGVPQVVVSLWNVDDRATAELMYRFYRALEHTLSPVAALQDAQLSMRGDPRWEAPVYWAGFILQGDWK